MNGEVKLCIKCKHRVHDDIYHSMCGKWRSPVHGKPAEMCHTQRLNSGPCGPLGEYWEPIPGPTLRKRFAAVVVEDVNRVQRCEAMQKSDQMVCESCELTWDMNDMYPPVCRKAAKRPSNWRPPPPPDVGGIAGREHCIAHQYGANVMACAPCDETWALDGPSRCPYRLEPAPPTVMAKLRETAASLGRRARQWLRG